VSSDDPTSEAPHPQPPSDLAPLDRYEIRVRGHLATRWARWFDGLTLTCEDDGTTVISGPIADQAALHGLLQKLRDLAIPLLSLTPSGPAAPSNPATPSTPTDPTDPAGATDFPHHPDRPNPPGAPS
jgi:hypothetical protein